ncbi:hypothetical protein KR222_004665 [Zaprionus bogoriensis]|nr:hypothetical protein KR222_004665 [Zaprionus bogoriensis]
MKKCNQMMVEPRASSPANRKQKRMPSTKAVKDGSVLKAIEDIQRMSPEAIMREFDRLVLQTERHFREQTQIPCAKVAGQLMRCLDKYQQQSCKCFDVMEDYRNCVLKATQHHVDRMAADDDEGDHQRRADQPPPIVVMPPANIPPPAAVQAEKASASCWYKPWTWLY